MNILLIGNTGQLGWELERTLSPLGSVLALDYPYLDLTKPESVIPIIEEQHPQVIVNATAYTAVDQAESEPKIAMAVNGKAPGMMAEAARKTGAALIHYSTDYVFDGNKGSPYTEEDAPNPLSIYAQSKLAGEEAIQQVGGAYFIIRTSWMYSLRRDSFVTKVLRWSRQNQNLKIVADQISNPTWARLLAEITGQLLAKGTPDIVEWVKERSGLYHLAGNGYTSRFEWAQAILRLDPKADEQIATEILPGKTEEFPTPAARPLFSALNCDLFHKTFGLQLPPWEQALNLAMTGD